MSNALESDHLCFAADASQQDSTSPDLFWSLTRSKTDMIERSPRFGTRRPPMGSIVTTTHV